MRLQKSPSSHRTAALLLTALLLGGALYGGISLLAFDTETKTAAGRILRLHVVANSDSEADQALKLAVRDALLPAFSDCFGSAADVDEAVGRAETALPLFEQTALTALQDGGADYGAVCRIVEEYFPTVDYGDYLLPAGVYRAVRVELGAAKGKNWFCIAFPPLCLPTFTDECSDAEAVAALDEARWVLKTKKPGYIVKLKLLEWIKSWTAD